MMYDLKDISILFLIIGIIIFFKGFQSNLDFLSIIFIYIMIMGLLVGIYLTAEGILTFLDRIDEYSKKMLSKNSDIEMTSLDE